MVGEALLVRAVARVSPVGRPEALDRELAGGTKLEDEHFTAFAPNITPDPDTGIGAVERPRDHPAIREGKRPDGTIIGPPMPIAPYRGM